MPYRIFLWLFASLSVLGNLGSIILRLINDTKMTSFNVFVTSLCLADSLMGMYLSVIGIMDFIYKGDYLFHSRSWKKSLTCDMAGFMSFVSSEVSAFMILLITIDRLLVLRFPFSKVMYKPHRFSLKALARPTILDFMCFE